MSRQRVGRAGGDGTGERGVHVQHAFAQGPGTQLGEGGVDVRQVEGLRDHLFQGDEARQANEDSFYFTNITPQRDTFNQSRSAGVWGELENALLDSAKADRQRVSVFAGPVLAPDDLPHRGVLVPYTFWKLIAYATDAQVAARAFVLRQNLEGLEQVALEDFVVYEVPVDDLEQRTQLRFDPALAAAVAQGTEPLPRRVRTVADVSW